MNGITCTKGIYRIILYAIHTYSYMLICICVCFTKMDNFPLQLSDNSRPNVSHRVSTKCYSSRIAVHRTMSRNLFTHKDRRRVTREIYRKEITLLTNS